MSLILVAKKSGKQVDLSKVVKNGKYTELAVPGEEYYVIDSETGKTPTDIEVSRSGDDLIIKSPSEDITVVIDEFWHDCTPDMQCYAIFDVPAVDGLEAGQVTVTQVGPDVSAFKPGMVGILPEGHSVSPWLWVGLGAALVGGLAAGGGGGGGGSSHAGGDKQPPAADTTPPEIKDGSLDVSDDGKQVTGKTEPGATVTVKDENGKTIGTGTADQDGNFNIPLDTPKTNGETLTVTAQDQAGNTSKPETVKADDSTAPAAPTNLDVSDDGSSVSGKAEPGTTVTIRDENGNPIGEGKADQNGNFTIPVNPPKTNGEPLTAEATDGAGNTSPKAGVNADDNTAPTKPTLTNDSEDNKLVATEDKDITGSAPDAAGGTAVLVDGNGNPVKDSAGNPITAPIDDNGNFTLPAAGVPDGDYGVQVKDKAGNPSADNAPISIDRTVPKITSVEFADNNNPSSDNQLTRNEVGTDGKTVVNVKFDPTTVKADDVIDVNGVKHTITAADITAGQAQVEIPVDVAPGSQGTLDVTAQITDTAGNKSNVVDNSIAVNRAADGIPRVEYIDDGANGGSKNGTLTAAEISGDGTPTTTARIVLPGNLENGDTVSIPDLSGTPYTVNGDKVGDFPIGTNTKGEKYIDVQVPVAEGATSLTTPVVVTVDGIELPATGNIKVDTVAPQEAPVLTVEGVTAEDTTINAAEAKDGLDLKVTIPQGTQEGDHIIIKDGTTTLLDRPLTKEEAESDEISLNISAPANGTTVNLTATVKEPREDGIAKDSNTVTATVDTEIPGGADTNGDGLGDAAPVITFTQDTQPEDGKLNAAELNGQKAAVTIEVPTGVAINDTLVYTVNGGTEQTMNITAAVKENGFTVPADQLPETGTITVKAYVKDAAGNRSAEAEEAAKIDTSIAKPTPSEGVDGSVNIALPSDAEKGDTVTVEYTDEAGKPQTVTLTKGDNGWTSDKPELIKHPTGDTATIPEEGVKDNTPVEITAKDTAGNTSPADPFKAPDVTAPSQPQPSANDDGSVKLELPTDANPGDQVKVTVTPEGATEPTEVTLTKQPDGTWESNKPTIIPSTTEANKDTTTIPENQVKDGSTVTAVATDGTNSSDPKTVDATDTRTPMLSLTDQSADKVLGKDEGNSITGKVTYDSIEETADKAEGAKVILKNAQGEQVDETTAAADGTFTFASVADGTYSIEVTSASNVAGAPITDVLVDHKAPAAQDITLANDTAGASATDNISYDGTLVIPTLGDGESIKSVTVGGATVTPDPVTGKYFLNPGEYAVGTIKVVVEDKAGYETESSNSKAITIDTTAPAQPTIDPQTNGSVNITLPTENVKTGDTVEVTYTDESGVKQTVTLTKGNNGWTSDNSSLTPSVGDDGTTTLTIPATSVQDGSEVNAVAKDPAGNKNTAAPQDAGNNPDTTAPSAPGLTPKADGTMDVGLPADANVGDKVEVKVIPEGGTAEDAVTVTLEKKSDGTWESGNEDVIPSTTQGNPNTATIPENQVKDGSEVTAIAKDDAGNSSDPTTKNATDERTPVVALTDESGDKFLKAGEGDDITGTVNYSDGDIAEGAKVELFDAQGTKAKETTADKDGNFTLENVADGTYSIKVTSASGKPGTGVDNVVVDHGVPGDSDGNNESDQAPSVAFVENDQNPSDGKISRNEIDADGTVKVKVTLPANVNAGDTVVLTTNGSATPVEHPLTAEEVTAGKAIISIPVGNVGNNPDQPVDGEKLTVKAVVKDQADQESLPSSEESIFVNQRVTGAPSVAYPEDGANGGFKDKVLWATEIGADNSTPVKVVLPNGIEGGDTVTVTINDAPVINHVVVQQDTGTGKRTITVDEKVYEIKTADESLPEGGKETITFIEVPVSTEGKTEIKAVVDVAIVNDQTPYHAEGTVTIDTAVPGGDSDNNNQGDETGKPTLAIAEAEDEKVSAEELSDGKVVATVTLPEGVQAGDHIILKDANGNVLADVPVGDTTTASTEVTVDIPKANLPNGDYTVTAIVKEGGTNGRESAPSNEVSFKVDTDAPEAPKLTATQNGGVDITLPADAQKGDTVEVKYIDENGDEQTVTLIKGDNGWTSGNKDVIPDSSTNQVTLPADQVKDGTEVNATASDGVNPDVPATPVTVNDTRTPVITLTGESADNQLVKTDGKTITGTVTYSDGDSAETATVTLVNTATNAETGPVTVGADGTFTFENVADGVYTVKATNGDTPAESKTVTVDHTGPADAAITFANDTGTAGDKISSDGTLNIAPATDATGIVDNGVEYSKDGGTTWTPLAKDANGKYVLPEDGTYSVRVTTEDNVGNTTTTKVDGFKVDTKEPADATIKLTEDTGESRDDNISKEGGLTITPADGATIQKVEYQDATGWHTFEEATYTLPEGTYAANAIKVTTVDKAGNTKETFNTDPITVDKTPPTPGTVTIAKDTGTLGTDGITNDGTLVTPTLGEGESIKSVTVKGEPLSPNADGKYILSAGTYAAEDIQVTVVDKAGNETVSDNDAAITVDTTPPAKPTFTPATADGDGSVTVGLPTSANAGDKVEVTFTGEDDQPVTITLTKDQDGWTTSPATLPTGVTLNGNTLTIGEDAVKDGTPVNAKSIDVAGNENAATAANAGNDALSTIPSVTVAEAQDGYVNKADLLADGGLNGTTTNAPDGSTIKLLDKDGNPVDIGPVTVTGGTFTIPADKVPEGDYKITVTTPTADGGKTSAPTPLFTVDKTVAAPTVTAATADGDGSVTVGLPTNAKVGDKVEVSVIPESGTAENPTKVTLEKQQDGTWKSDMPAVVPSTTTDNKDTTIIPENAVQDGSTVTAKSVDTAGNEAVASPTATAGNDALSTTPTVTVAEAADGYVNAAELEDGGLTGTTTNAANGSTVQLLKGDEVVATTTVANNAFTFAKADVSDGTYTIKVTTPEADGAKEVSTSEFTVDTATPKITAHGFITNDTAGVNDANNDGTITYSELNGKTTVKYEVSFSGAVKDTKLLVVAYPIEHSDTPTTAPVNVNVTLTAEQAAAGKVTVEIPITATPDSTAKVGDIQVTRILLQDPAKNRATVTDEDGVVDSLHIDMTPPSIELDTPVTDKGVNATELANGISGTVNHLPTGTQQVQLYNEAGQPVGYPANVDPTTGKFTIQNTDNTIPDGDKYTVKLVSNTNIKSAEFTVDATVHAPTVTASTENGNGGVTVALPTTDVKVGDKVEVTFTGEDEGTVSITLTKGQDNWAPSEALPTGVDLSGNTLTIGEDAVKDGSKVNAKSIDTAGNEAEADPATAGSDEPKPVITMDAAEIANGVNKDELSNGIPGTVTNAPEGAKVQLYKGEEAIGDPIPVGVDGTFTIPSTIADGDYTVKLVDYPDVTPATFTVDATPPATADITLANDTGDSAEDGISNDGGLLLPELAEGETIQSVTINGTPLDTDGNGNYILPEGEYPKDSIKVTITDTAGNTSVSTNSSPITVDTTTPAPKEVDAASGMVTLPDNAKDGDKVIISYTDEAGTPQTITVTKGSSGWSIEGGNGTPTVEDSVVFLTEPDNSLPVGTVVTAYGVDKAGNSKTVAKVVPPSEDTGSGDYVRLDSSVLDGINATELADGVKGVASGSTILYDPTGNPIGSGGQSLGIGLSGVEDGDGFYVKSGSAQSPKFEIDTHIGTPTVKPSTTDGSVTVELPTTDTKTGDKVQITYYREGATTPTTSTVVKTADGWAKEQLDSPIVLNNDGTVTLPQDLVKDGSTVTATAIDKVGNTNAVTGTAGADVPTITIAEASDGTVTAAELEDDGGLTGTTTNAANGSTVQLLKKATGEVVATTTVANNAFTFAKADVPGGTYTVKVTTPAGKTASTNEFEVTTAPTISMGAEVINAVNATELSDGISGTVTNAPENAKVQLYKGDTAIGNQIDVTNGSFTIPKDSVTDDEGYTVKLVDQEATVASKPFTVDTTAPKAGVTAKEDGSVEITLPTTDLKNGDEVAITYTPTGGSEKTVSLSYDNGQWTGLPADLTLDNGKVIIPADKVADNTIVKAVGSDLAGNTQEVADGVNQATAKTPIIRYDDLAIVFPGDDISNNDAVAGYDVVVNKEEWENITNGSNANYRVYLPDGVAAGDKISFPWIKGSGTTSNPYVETTQTYKLVNSGLGGIIKTDPDNDQKYVEIPATGLYGKLDQDGNYTAKITLLPVTSASTLGSDPIDGYTKIYLDDTPPAAPDVATQADSSVKITLPTDADAATVTVQAGDKTVILTKDEANGAWTSSDPSVVSVNGKTATIPAGTLADGTAVTATAADKAGNTSSDSDTIRDLPITLDSLKVTSTDVMPDTTGVQIEDSTPNYEYTLGGTLRSDKTVQLQLVDSTGKVLETQYKDIVAGQNTYTGEFTYPVVANNQNYKIVATVVGASSNIIATKDVSFNVDNVHTPKVTLASDNNAVYIDGALAGGTFGSAQNDKFKDLTDERVYNPKLDWLVRPDDEDGYDGGNEIAGTSNDSAWSTYSGNTSWTGSSKNDIIIAAPVQTDEYDTGRRYKGVIGAGDGGVLTMDTGAGHDYIEATGGITGQTKITTGTGDDVISTVYINGKNTQQAYNASNFNGTQVISMGDGNDQFLVTGKASDVGIGGYNVSGDENSALFYTDIKVDMGNGDDVINITEKIIADKEPTSGNYFALGAGNDVMTTGAMLNANSNSFLGQATNIVNLGTGSDVLTINGDIACLDNGYTHFLLVDEVDGTTTDTNTVLVTGSVNGKSSMMMNSANDNIRIDGNLNLWPAEGMNWLNNALRAPEVAGDFYSGYYEDLKTLVQNALTAGAARAEGTNIDMGSSLLHGNIIPARIDLGDGDNNLSVGGDTSGAIVLGGSGKDVVKLAFDANGNPNSHSVSNTGVATGAGDDLVMISNAKDYVKVWTGADNDDIQLYDVDGSNNEVHAGNGDDIIRLYGGVNNSNSNTIDGGADYDKVIIGNSNDSAANKFLVGGSEDGYTNLWNIEEIQFNSGVSDSGDTVKVNAQTLNDSHTLYIRGTSELNAQGAGALGVNTVDIDKNVWSDRGTTTKELSDGTSYTYHHYTTTTSDGTTEHLYIQNGIQVI
ncbi:Ig-like domain-containing protein [Pelistega europaea]|uniref:Bacterial Ig domain-containing protein n=1 Tax=Pelistega europaea TaxID=106147 RepID=A0A7Y4LA36_9BURK|nr:Ig-like domain-containing protein [Pelistega europaea]NOL49728.1 hypothetical protein [Pelistega europaea]